MPAIRPRGPRAVILAGTCAEVKDEAAGDLDGTKGPGLLPNLLVIGAMKGGTTSLWEYLRQHPEIFMSPTKEIHYFDEASHRNRGVGWYEQHFEGASAEHRIVGEATPAYTRFPLHRDVPARAAELLPGVKLVYVLRDPVARIRSHYLHHRSLGIESLPFARAVVEHSTYVDTSRYALQIDQWLRHFPREQLLVLTSERLRKAQRETMAEVYAFLGVDPTWTPPPGELHRTEDKHVPVPRANRIRSSRLGTRVAEGTPAALRPALLALWGLTRRPVDTSGADLDPALRVVLEDLVREDTHRLRAYLGPDFDCWGI